MKAKPKGSSKFRRALPSKTVPKIKLSPVKQCQKNKLEFEGEKAVAVFQWIVIACVALILIFTLETYRLLLTHDADIRLKIVIAAGPLVLFFAIGGFRAFSFKSPLVSISAKKQGSR